MDVTGSFLTKVLGPADRRQKQVSPGPTVGADAQMFSAAAFSEGVVAPMTARQLRQWYETNPWIFSCVEQRASDISAADWEIRAVDPTVPYDKGALTAIRELFEAPNPEGRNDSFGSLQHPTAVDSCCLDKGATQVLRDKGGQPEAMKALDGARVFVKPTWQSNKDGARYLYMNQDGTDGTPLMNDELMLIEAHPSTYRADGLAPLKVLNRILIAEYDTFKSIHILQKNRAPSAILKMPGASPEAVETAKSLWLNELAGRSGLGFMSIPDASDLMVLGSTNLAEQGAFQFYDMLIRAITAVFRTATLNLNWLQDVNRATAQESSKNADDGTVAHLKLIQRYYNREVVSTFRQSDNIGFFYTQLPRDEALSIEVVRTMAGRMVNPWSINDMLTASGFKRVQVSDSEEQEFYDKPLIGVSNGQMATPSVAMKLPQYQDQQTLSDAQAQQTGGPVQLPHGSTGRPNNDNKPHPVDSVIGAAPAQAQIAQKGTPSQDIRRATDDLFSGVDAFFMEARDAARAALNGKA
jgi:hypothetical protein